MTTLAAIGVVAGYGRTNVLTGCDLALRAGEVAALVGANGAGKSTLLRVLAGLLRPRAGRATLDGADLATLSRAELATRIAVVPQVLETLFPFTIREVVGLGRLARLGLLGTRSAEDRAAVSRALSDLQLDRLAEQRIDQVSGGERQRAVLAMALAQESDVLLLDEPTAHLDPGHQRALLALVAELARARGLVVLAVLHDLNLAAALCGRVAILHEGRIAHDGPPAEVLTPEIVRGVFGEGLIVDARGGRPVVLPRP